MSGSSSCSFRVKAAIANELVDKPAVQASSSCSVAPESTAMQSQGARQLVDGPQLFGSLVLGWDVALDFQIVLPQESIILSKVSFVPGTGVGGVPLALMVEGDDFTSIDEVQINSITSPDVIILSQHQLIAQVPDLVARGVLTTVTVLSRKLTVTPHSFLRFRIPRTPGRVSGILRLMQLYLKILFTTPGTDIFSPTLGGGILENLGATFGADQGGDIVSNLAVAVNRTTRQIVALQSRDQRTPRDERLLSANLSSAGFNRAEAALIGTIAISSQAGRTALANLEL